ncbi:MAG: general secretion pathway protein GspK [Myxococcales bacterium]|nr:general secretion pathway protein GspK [Myxococcales bacterium]
MKSESQTAARTWRHGYVELPAHAQRTCKKGARRPGRGRRPGLRRHDPERRAGVAMVVVLTVVAILTVFVAELLNNTSTAFHVAVSERDRLRSEYLAKSGMNLMRLLIAREPDIRRVVGPMYQMAFKRPPPQLNVWDFADLLLAPFADIDNAKAMGESGGMDFGLMEGVGDTGGTFEIIAVPENAKLNLNKPLFFAGDDARRSEARQLFALMGGLQSPASPYDPMFSARDADGHYTTRLDIVSAMIDWWDYDEQRTVYDPGSTEVSTGGSEDDIYGQFRDPYDIKNAPFDSIEELRLIRGVGEDFWATFIEKTPGDPRSRNVTIYGSGAVNVNLAPPVVLLSRLCSYLWEQPMCNDPMQWAAFTQLLETARAIAPVPLFTTPREFVDFVSGKGSRGLDIFSQLQTFLPPDSPLMAWTPLNIPADQQQAIQAKFLTAASMFTIQSVGRAGRAETTISAVVNFHRTWTPPKGVAGKLPPLGVFHHYRIQ